MEPTVHVDTTLPPGSDVLARLLPTSLAEYTAQVHTYRGVYLPCIRSTVFFSTVVTLNSTVLVPRRSERHHTTQSAPLPPATRLKIREQVQRKRKRAIPNTYRKDARQAQNTQVHSRRQATIQQPAIPAALKGNGTEGRGAGTQHKTKNIQVWHQR